MKTYPYAVIISRVLSAFRNALMSGHFVIPARYLVLNASKVHVDVYLEMLTINLIVYFC